jgi:hypothetical protein
VYLLLVFAPFLLLGLPMLLVSWWLLTRAAAAQHHQVTPITAAGDSDYVIDDSADGSFTASGGSRSSSGLDGPGGLLSLNSSSSGGGEASRVAAWKAALQRVVLQRPWQMVLQGLQQLLRLLVTLCALLDVGLVLLLGGHWAAGISAWESAGMWLRRQAWLLLHLSCSKAGAAFIK